MASCELVQLVKRDMPLTWWVVGVRRGGRLHVLALACFSVFVRRV